MRRLACLLLALPVLLPAFAHADGCPPTSCGTSSAAVPGSRVLALRPNGSNGPLVAYDLATGAKRFTPSCVCNAKRGCDCEYVPHAARTVVPARACHEALKRGVRIASPVWDARS